MIFPSPRRHAGAAIVIMVILVGVVSLVVGLSVFHRGLKEAGMGSSTGEWHKLVAIADACMEEALERMAVRTDTVDLCNAMFPCVKTITIGAGSCTSTVDNAGLPANEYTVYVTGTLGTMTRRIRAHASAATRPITLLFWGVH